MDEQARIQRLREYMDTNGAWGQFGEDVAALLAAHAALVKAAQWLIDELSAPDDEYRLNEADKAMDAVIALLAPAAPQPAASPAATDAPTS